MTKGLVTVLVAAYNEGKHIAECIESILKQTYKLIEIIVIDDGSTDRTAEVVRRFSSVRLISQNHLGKALAVNRGAKESNGEILLFLDGDMFFEKSYVEKMAAPILSGECVGTCHTDEYVANPDNIWSACFQIKAGLPLNRRLKIDTTAQKDGSIVFRAIRKDLFINSEGFENTGYLDDQTIYPKLLQKAKFVNGAACYHYNPETLLEVFSSGRWGGKSIAVNHSFSSLFYYFPFISIFRSFKIGYKFQYPFMVLYELVYELGIFYGLVSLLFGREKSYGK